MKRRPQKRRGILLLIVLSLLVLFVLIGVTFVVVANQYTRSAIAAGKYEMTGDDPSQELDSALYSILRGSANPGDLTYRHSILSDLYGRDGFIGTVTAVAPEAQGEFLRIAFQTVGGSALRGSDYYAGSVLTLMDGNGRGHSTRVVRFNAFDPNVGGPTIVVTGFESLPNFAPKVSERFLVNGRPFNGTGDGYQPQAGSLRKTQTNYLAEVALLPNMRESTFVGSMLGDSDESWDAPDYQNYFLARIPTGANTSQRNDPLIPSFHRPFLINYWINRFEDGGLKWDGPDLDPFRNFIISRPLPRFHPLFTGSNPAFDRSFDTDGDGVPDAYDSDLDGDDAVDANLLSNLPILNGPWDVDNDNDGIADSIWIDLGMPVKMAPDGRLYKPLFAILCVDLDGRLNLNAHDNPMLASLGQQPLPNQPNLAAYPQSQLNEISNLTRGQGYGPAEIQLSGAVGGMLEGIFRNRYSQLGDMRMEPGAIGENAKTLIDPLSAVKQWEMTNDYQNQAQNQGSAYQSPSDLRGVGGVFLDHAGNPHYKLMGAQNETFDDPYETNLVTPNATDTTFTYAEQEQLLRAFDSDSMGIGSRLRDLFQAQWISDPHRLRRFTTHSFEIGTPNTVPPTESLRRIRDANDNRLLNPQVTVSDLVRARLIANGFANTDPLLVEEQVRLMVPSEIRQGRRMDVNRWLGNARDDNGNGVVDEPGEDSTSSRMWANTPFEANGQFAIDDPNRSSNPNNPHFAKQVYARQLYCLAMLLIDSRNGVASGQSGSDFVFESLIHNLNPNDSREITARRIAQWAINVVDFRDPDAIMTPFEFDLQPFDDDGWGVDDDFTSNSNEPDRGVVWGCEHPELIITETTAFHDRRVKDTDNDTTMTPRLPPDDADEEFVPDDDLDQYRIPQGSLFLELFCMRNRFQNNSQAPPELYVKNNNTGQVFLDLGRVVNGSPVWRVAIGDPPEPGNTTGENAVKLPAVPRQDPNYENNNNNQPFDPNDEALLAGLRSTGIPTANFERFVIFSNMIPANVPGNRAAYYYNRFRMNTQVEPGQYLVVGPRETTGLGSKRNAAPNTPSEISDQQIVLRPNAVAFPQTVLNTNQNVENTNGPNLMIRRPVVGMIAAADIPLWNEPKLLQNGAGLSVSEPLPTAYYQEPTWPDDDSELPSYYDNPEAPLNTLPDEPYDQRPGRPLEESPELLMTGTHEDFRVAVLQRLANPTEGYHPVRNPYVSLDTQTIDLTVFNGEERSSADPPPEWDQWEAQYGDFDPSDDPDLAPEIIFRTRERGTPRVGISMLWNPLTLPLQQAGQGPPPPPMQNNPYWSERLVHTLGHLNRSLYRDSYPVRTAGITVNPRELRYIGDPQASHLFPWLVWNNRPFVSHFELMQVPSAPPWRLLYEFRGRNLRNNVDIYEESDGNFSHLLNFTQSKEGSSGTHANLSRLFDYLEVPSRFVGTEHWFNPTTFANIQNMASPDLHGFATPFNRVSKFRNPGKVNINTIPDQTVWTGIEPSQPQKWNEIEQSLRGDLPTDKRPAFYSNPVRSASAADLMPLSELERDPVQATLLRSNDAGDEMLFSFELNESQRYNSPEHNSYFAYHRLQRLGNLLTTHSNVYAVWITVGYFEVHPWNPNNPLNTNLPPVMDAEHPDGYQLGLELGSDTGETRRHRAFYMIDRSIPVGFQPGENHNVDEAVVLRRMLE